MNIRNTKNNPHFGAYHITTSGNLKLYKITDPEDLRFIKNLPQKIKMNKLMPNLTKDETARWQEMLEYAVDNSRKKENVTYLEAIDNNPCGIITFTPGKTTILDCICTWPVEFGKKVEFAGKTLFYQLFLDFQKIKGKRIKLDAITNGPYNTIKKYESLGFKQTSNVHPTKIQMETNSSKVKDTMLNLKQLLKYKEISPQKINIYSELA